MNLNCDPYKADIGTTDFCRQASISFTTIYSINISSATASFRNPFYLYWEANAPVISITVSNVSVSYGAQIQFCNGVSEQRLETNPPVHPRSHAIMVQITNTNIECDTNCSYRYTETCDSQNILNSSLSLLCPSSSLMISSVTSTVFMISMPPSLSIISSSTYPTHDPSLTSYSSATTVSSFSLFSPTISPSPLLCPAENQWPNTGAGQNATGTCHKGTFNGQFDHSCYTLYLSFH